MGIIHQGNTTRSGRFPTHKNVKRSRKDVGKPIPDAKRNVEKIFGRNTSGDLFPPDASPTSRQK
uniref:Uncharacterized protein n=1 Tax=Cucumis melo TaxID=3656 RepID=A0A9I9D1E6_CUCME